MTSAIIGLAARLPGARDLEQFWQVLASGACTVSDAPHGRWSVERFLHPNPAELGFSYSFAGGYINQPLHFDPLAFGISPREAAQIDPQQRLLLELVWEALEDAGIPPSSVAGQRIGVYVGASNVDYQGAASIDQAVMESHFITGISLAIASNRLSYTFDLKGPSMTVDTACSSSIVALDKAASAIERGEIDTAIVAGVNMLLSPIPFIGFSRARMLSPTGRSRPFSAKADGYVRAEGGAAFVLRRLDVARAAGNTVRSIVMGTGVNSDGRTVGVSLPSVEGQASLLVDVYQRAQVEPESLAFLEAHGTGTPVGDPIEARAIGEALGQRRKTPLTIGSVKSNIGHLESASGAAAMVKVVLALEKGVYPRTLHLDEPSPHIDLGELNLRLAVEDLSFSYDESGSAFAGICNYGFGGTNAHAILRAPTAAERSAAQVNAGKPAQMLAIGAHTREALSALAASYRDHLEDEAVDLDLVARAAVRQRDLLKHRAVIPIGSRETVLATLGSIAAGEAPSTLSVAAAKGHSRVVFVFPGNGCQWAGMGVSAYRLNEDFARELRDIDALFQAEAGWSLIDTLHAPDLKERLGATSVAQPLIYAIQSALAGVLRQNGLRPDFVLGHSVGEIAAAEVSGALSRAAAIGLVKERSLHQEGARGGGGMLAVSADGATAGELVAAVSEGLEIAAFNAPSSVTIVGTDAALKAFAVEARKRRTATLRLDIDYPFHSALLDDIRGPLLEGVKGIRPQASSIPFISSVTGTPLDGETLDAEYWWRNIRYPVRFHAAVTHAAQAGATLFVELSPRPILVASVAETCRECGVAAAAFGSLTDRIADAEHDPVLALLATLVARGVIEPSEELVGSQPTRKLNLPTYPWQRQLCVLPKTSEGIEAYGRIDGGKRHPLIGTRLAHGSPEWRMLLDGETVPYLLDHRVGGEVVVPGAAMVEMALAVGREIHGDGPLELIDMDIARPLILGEQAMRELSIRYERSLSRVEIWSRPRFGDEWTFNAGGRVDVAQGTARIPDAIPATETMTGHDHAEVYRASTRAGLGYGPAFQRVARLRRNARWLDAELAPAALPLGAYSDQPILDPTSLDAAFHGLFLGLDQKAGETRAFLPVRIRRLRTWLGGAPAVRALIEVTRETPRSMSLRGALLDRSGAVVAEFDGVYLRAAVLARGDDANRVFRTRFTLLRDVQDLQLPPAAALDLPLEAPPAWLLARAIVIAATHETLLGLSADGKLEIDGTVSRGLVHPEMTPLLGAALRLLESAHLARESDGSWALEPQSGFPSPDKLIASLAERYPEATAELQLANAVAARLGERLRSGESCLAPELKRHFWSDAAFLQEHAYAVENWLRQAAEKFGRPLRVAILEPTAQILHDSLRPLGEAGLVELFSVRDGAVGSSASRVTTVDLSAATGTGPGLLSSFDALVGLPIGDMPGEAGLARLEASLAPTAALFVGVVPHDDALDVMLGLGPDWLRTSADPWLATGPTPEATMIAATARRIGFAVAETPNDPDHPSFLTGARHTPAPAPAGFEASLAMPDPALHANTALAAALTARMGEGAAIHLDLPLASDRDSIAEQARALRIVERLRQLSEAEAETSFWIVTHDAFARDGKANPDADALWSFGRVAMNEFPAIDLRLVDLASALSAEEAAGSLLSLLAAPGSERELLVAPEGVSAPRVERDKPKASFGLPQQRTRLVAEHGAGFEQFDWHWLDRRAPGDGEVEISVEATGLNFRDVMVGMGLLDEELLAGGMSAAALGFECAGRVVQVGPGVRDLVVGDQVMGFAADAFSSHVTSSARSFVKVPHGLSSEAAATIPVAFSTAWFALNEVARLRAGETVLIHGAVGSVGQAALQIARLVGARIIATAGSPERRRLALALGAEAAYDSRSLDFAEQIRAEYGGVDVVLNSLAGDAMRAGFRLLRPFGRFIELGKRDFLENTALELRPFVRNLSYFGVDLDELLAHDPQASRRVLEKIVAGFESGALKALSYRAFSGENVADAMRLMQRSAHVGKIVVRPAQQAIQELVPLSFKPVRGPFLVLGGTGGFGLETAIWLAAQGANPVVVASRRGRIDPAAADRFAAYDGRIVAEQADATDPDSVKALLDRVREAHGPLAGIVHTAMVLEDGLLDGLTERSLSAVVLPKARGVRVLDEATRGDPLQCFVVYSSATTLIGNPGQGAYVLANAYMEGVMRERRLAGLPALAVGWGAIADAGVIARDTQLGERLQRTTGVAGLPFSDALNHLGRLLALGGAAEPVQVYTSLGNSAVAKSLAVLKSPAFAALNDASNDQDEAVSINLATQIIGKNAAEALEIVLSATKAEIGRILRMDADSIDARRPLSEIGMDSLMALELRLGVEKRIGIELPLMSLGDRTAVHVAEKILAGLSGQPETESEVVSFAGAMATAHGGDGIDLAKAVVGVIDQPAVKGGVL